MLLKSSNLSQIKDLAQVHICRVFTEKFISYLWEYWKYVYRFSQWFQVTWPKYSLRSGKADNWLTQSFSLILFSTFWFIFKNCPQDLLKRKIAMTSSGHFLMLNWIFSICSFVVHQEKFLLFREKVFGKSQGMTFVGKDKEIF